MEKTFCKIIPFDLLKHIKCKFGNIAEISNNALSLNNDVFRVKTQSQHLLVKIFNHKIKAINRLDEVKAIGHFHNLSITPKLLDYKINKYLILEYVNSNNILSTGMLHNDIIDNLQKSLCKIHGSNLKLNTRSFGKTIDYYHINTHKIHKNNNIYMSLLKYKNDILDEIKSYELNLGVCHNDLHLLNIINYNKHDVYFIDFEYASINDIYFDLASMKLCLSENEFDIFIAKYIKSTNLSFQTKKLDAYVILQYTMAIFWYYYQISINNENTMAYTNLVNDTFVKLENMLMSKKEL